MTYRDYETDRYSPNYMGSVGKLLKKRCDFLADLSHQALTALETSSPEEYKKLMKVGEHANWWANQKAAEKVNAKKDLLLQEKKKEKAKLKKIAVSKLSVEELAAFGLSPTGVRK